MQPENSAKKDDVYQPKGTIDNQPLPTFNPLCQDENGRMKLDMDGKKRQVIGDPHPQPCASEGMLSLENLKMSPS